MIEDLNDDTFELFAAKAYDKPNAIVSEFEEDLNRILYLKRLLTKYYNTGILKDRLIMNHLIVLYNVFGIDSATRLLFFKLDEKDYEIIKPFLICMHFLPEYVHGINGKTIDTKEIRLNADAVECVKRLKN